MQKLLVVFLSCVAAVLAQTWVQRATVTDHVNYIRSVMEEVVQELEEFGWSNLKLDDVHQNISAQMYKWTVKGKVHYFNGYLVSMQKVDLTTITQSVGRRTVDGVQIPFASVSSQLIFRNPKLGYDLISDIEGIGVQRSTGEMTLPTITIASTVQKQLDNGEISVLSMRINNGGGLIRMIYHPASNVTEVLSRNFFPYTFDFSNWVPIIEPMLLNVIKNKIPFPDVCYLNCT
ncbi:uncharacterized protein LOC113504823 [Trichoplusia ni]|uniref:Uncharacterized protein LOC113504823 n=1 Tax=Trichoplusia ni TaxID=7111 RepID=A0A7E5WQQ2_TRINI|nr:uncharacterized protein LOC113504823 [Trichoplusia ni]